MKRIIYILMIIPILLTVMTACETETGSENMLVGKWLLSDSVPYYADDGISTFIMTFNLTMDISENNLFSVSGTSTPEGEALQHVLGDGTYTADESAGTIAFLYQNYTIDDVSQNMDMLTFLYEVTDTRLTLSSPEPGAYTPVEDLVYTRQ